MYMYVDSLGKGYFYKYNLYIDHMLIDETLSKIMHFLGRFQLSHQQSWLECDFCIFHYSKNYDNGQEGLTGTCWKLTISFCLKLYARYMVKGHSKTGQSFLNLIHWEYIELRTAREELENKQYNIKFWLKNSELSFFSHKIALRIMIVYISSRCLPKKTFMSDFSFVYCLVLIKIVCLFKDEFL